MTREEIDAKIREILSSEFEVDADSVTDASNLVTDLDLDSIDAVDLVVRIQQLTGKRVDPALFRTIRTYGDVLDAVVRVVNS